MKTIVKGNRIMTYVRTTRSFLVFAALLVFLGLLASCGNPTGSEGTVYEIGDKGPGGGIIFFDKGYRSNGWRYMEAAPYSAEFESSWTPEDKTDVEIKIEEIVNTDGDIAEHTTSTWIGYGKSNTQLIVEVLKKEGVTDSAAQKCRKLSTGNKRDWFLPSHDELDWMYKNLKENDLGNFSEVPYWSSSQHDNINSAWVRDFRGDASGDSYGNTKNTSLRVRAVRSF